MLLRQLYHFLGNVNPVHLVEIGAQGSRKSSYPTAEIENSPIRTRSEATDLHQIIDLTLTAGKELLKIPPPKLLLIVAKNRPERIQLRKVFPFLFRGYALGGRS